MNTKIRIDLTQGIVEAEGTEDFVRSIYEDFRARIELSGGGSQNGRKEPPRRRSTPKKREKSDETKGRSARKATGSSGALKKDLDLSGKGSKKSLREFYDEYSAKTNLERNLIFIYYLQNIKSEKEIGIDHVFTCYRSIPKLRVPGNLKQSLYDTSSKGWIEIKSVDDDIAISVNGLNHIEHDIPKRVDGS